MNRFLLDTNAVIELLKGHDSLSDILMKSEWVGISIVTELEFLSFPGISKEDQALFSEFESRIEVVDLRHEDEALVSRVCQLRRKKQVKLPDAIVIASGVFQNAKIVTSDQRLLDSFPQTTMPLPERTRRG